MALIKINPVSVNNALQKFIHTDCYLHLETTNGAYATHRGGKTYSAGAFIRNAKVKIYTAKLTGNEPSYRVGLKIDLGWVYAEGLTYVEADTTEQVLLYGLDEHGKLAVALQISPTPFKE